MMTFMVSGTIQLNQPPFNMLHLIYDGLYAEYDLLKPIKFILGCSTVCAIKKDMAYHSDKMKSRHRVIVAVARLAEPYCVWVR
jgi:hypothetical protein